jgi:hypothetical protein
LTLTDTVGAKVSGQFTLAAESTLPSLEPGYSAPTCPLSTLASKSTSYIYVRLDNPTASALTVSVWDSKSTNAGSDDIDTIMAAYGSTKPTTSAERKACTVGVGDECDGDSSDDPTACASYGWSGLLLSEDTAVTIPPNDHVWIYIAAWDEDETGDFQLTARTESAE